MLHSSEKPDFYDFLAQRRSASVLSEPKPSRNEIKKILAVAGTVPDHGALRPFRFVVIEGEARESFGNALINAAEEGKDRGMPLEEKVKAKIKAKAFFAPVQILIIASPLLDHKIPILEQDAAAACTGYAMVLAANTLNYGAVWKSFAYAPGSEMKALFNLKHGEKVLGWINIGTEKDRNRSPRDPFPVEEHTLFLEG